MTFSPSFGRIFSPSFKPNSLDGAVAIPWYLSGGIAAANCIAAYQPKGAADYAASKVNLANPGTKNAVDGAAYPTWDATNGWIFNGSTQYLSSGVVPVNNQGWSMIVRFSEYTSGDDTVCGMYEDAGGVRTFNIGRNGGLTYFRNGGAVSYVLSLALGVLAIAGSKGYQNGSFATDIPSATGTINQPVYIGANAYNGGAVTNKFDGNIQALAIYNTVLTATQVGLLTTAMAAL